MIQGRDIGYGPTMVAPMEGPRRAAARIFPASNSGLVFAFIDRDITRALDPLRHDAIRVMV